MTPTELWRFLPIGYLLTILIETAVLTFGLSPHHPLRRRLFAGLWLTACTYPIVILVLPLLLNERTVYLIVAETFAPVAECVLFWFAFGKQSEVNRSSMWRDFTAIVFANLSSFAMGEILGAYNWFGVVG